MKYTPPIGQPDGAPFVNFDPSNGVDGSVIPAGALENPQREIVNALTAMGVTPDASKLNQLAGLFTGLKKSIADLNDGVGSVEADLAAVEKALSEFGEAMAGLLKPATANRLGGIMVGKGLGITLAGLLSVLVMEGSGLVTTDKGELYFDPSRMPTDKFEELLKSIRVPIWLSKSTTWYVDGTIGSDQNDGSSADKAFKTIQKALNYVSENYNLGNYSAVISVAAGTYAGFRLPKYNASTGSITVQGAGQSTIIAGEIAGSGSLVQTVSGAGAWTLRDMQTNMTVTGTGLVLPSAVLIESSSSLTLVNVGVLLDVRNEITGVANNIKVASASATLLISDGVSLTAGSARTTGLYVVGSAQYNGVNAPLNISGTFGTIIDVTNGAKFTRTGSPPAVITGTAVGKRYNVRALAVCDTSGGGPEYFPGNVAGTVDSTNFGVYK